VLDNTGFDFDRPAAVPTTAPPSPEHLVLMREIVAPLLAEAYPRFAAAVFGASIADVGERRAG
jgi:glutaconate CoA-transferase subunit B